jgi:hypothetical protein
VSDWLDTIPNLGVPGVTGVTALKSKPFPVTPATAPGVTGVPEHLGVTPVTPPVTPGLSAKSLKSPHEHLEHLKHRQNDQDASGRLAEWRDGLQTLDPGRALHGLAPSRWRVLVDDADWLFEQFAAAAARDGWSAADLFGVLPDHDGWGGVADRLRGSRSLVMTADVARWRRMHSGLPDSFTRGSSAVPRLTLLWDEGSDTTSRGSHG